MFKLDNNFWDSRGIAFLLNDPVGINERLNNRFEHPFKPRVEDIEKFIAQCCGQPNDQI